MRGRRLVAAVVAVVTLVSVIFIPNRPLRTTIDIATPDAEQKYEEEREEKNLTR